MENSPDLNRPTPSSGRWLHYFAVLTAVTTLPLIFVGGLVTSHDAALAVPDWPTSYGYNMFFFPWEKMVGGIFYEHSHRLIGSLVGMQMIVLTIWLFLNESRAWVKKLGAIALAVVIFQGLLGGLRVELVFKPIAIFHACLAQIFFCIISSIALFTSPFWKRLERGHYSTQQDQCLRKIALIVTSAIFIQLVLGAVMRHTNAGLAIPDFPKMYGQWLPPLSSESISHINDHRIWKLNLDQVGLAQILIHLSHRIWAFVVFLLTLMLFVRVLRNHSPCKPLKRPAYILMGLLIIQLILGMSVIWSQKAADIATAHVAVGAIALVTSFLLTLIAFKLVAPNPVPATISAASSDEAAA